MSYFVAKLEKGVCICSGDADEYPSIKFEMWPPHFEVDEITDLMFVISDNGKEDSGPLICVNLKTSDAIALAREILGYYEAAELEMKLSRTISQDMLRELRNRQ